jgi:hypothetical protein
MPSSRSGVAPSATSGIARRRCGAAESGFNVITRRKGDLGYALVSDCDDVHVDRGPAYSPHPLAPFLHLK